MRRIAELKSRLQRTNPVEHADGLQPDVRRAGRPRAAPPHAARAGDGRARERCRTPAPRPRPSAPGERRAGLGRTAAAGPWSPAPATRSTCRADRGAPASPSGSRGSRSRRPTGTATAALLRVREVGTWGEQRPEHTLRARRRRGRLLQLVRERVTRQRRPPAARARSAAAAGVRVIARRAPRRRPRRCTWVFEYDEGVDPDDPDVAALAAAGRCWPPARRSGST